MINFSPEEKLEAAEKKCRDLEEELRKTRQTAEAAGRAKSEFLANMSHELHTPLNSIIGFTEVLQTGQSGPLTEKQADYLNEVLASSRHLLALINEILDLSKIKAGMTVSQPADFKLKALLENLRSSASAKEKVSMSKNDESHEINGKTGKILVVDDDSINRKLLVAVLTPLGYSVKSAVSGEEALVFLEDESYDLVLLDVMMPGIDGYEACLKIKERHKIPVIMLTALTEKEDLLKGLANGADEFLTKPFIREELELRIKNILKIKEYQDRLEDLVKERTGQLELAYKDVFNSDRELINRLMIASEYRDDDTGKHITRVGRISKLLAEKSGCDSNFCESIEIAAPMHDIGKIGIPDIILLKPGKLTGPEFEIMKTHTTIGAKILGGAFRAQLKMAHEIALNHHEKWDGTGYPEGKKGEDIPLAARFTALSDVFDALLSERPYKHAYSWEKSLEIIKAGAGSYFDKTITETFLKAEHEIAAIYTSLKD